MDGMCFAPLTNYKMNTVNELITVTVGIGKLIGGSKYSALIIKLADKESKLEAYLESKKNMQNILNMISTKL